MVDSGTKASLFSCLVPIRHPPLTPTPLQLLCLLQSSSCCQQAPSRLQLPWQFCGRRGEVGCSEGGTVTHPLWVVEDRVRRRRVPPATTLKEGAVAVDCTKQLQREERAVEEGRGDSTAGGARGS